MEKGDYYLVSKFKKIMTLILNISDLIIILRRGKIPRLQQKTRLQQLNVMVMVQEVGLLVT